jgi:hypothetical protein
MCCGMYARPAMPLRHPCIVAMILVCGLVHPLPAKLAPDLIETVRGVG